ncbi:MAG: hypothetical protein P8X95_16445 [Anaerolineales bacterium]|jgi:hypothetical protein
MLSGALIDQAALFGVLKALYDMRLPLLSDLASYGGGAYGNRDRFSR